MNIANVGLGNHLADAGGVSEVPVDLERWMHVEQIVRKLRLEHSFQDAVGTVTIMEPGPNGHFPGPAPAGRAVTACVH